jgi:hypothetical protein
VYLNQSLATILLIFFLIQQLQVVAPKTIIVDINIVPLKIFLFRKKINLQTCQCVEDDKICTSAATQVEEL